MDCLSSLCGTLCPSGVGRSAVIRVDVAILTWHVVVRGRRVKRGFRCERTLTLAELKERPPGGKKLKGGKYQRSCLHDDITVRTVASMSAGSCALLYRAVGFCRWLAAQLSNLPKMPTRLS